ncbi:MAG: hypothetical protein Q7U16_16960 [Agitococcus sp.]|nr:hypothetical protein [Agitococcus sp.]
MKWIKKYQFRHNENEYDVSRWLFVVVYDDVNEHEYVPEVR